MEFCVKRFTTNYTLRYCKHDKQINYYGMGCAELFVANKQICLLYFKRHGLVQAKLATVLASLLLF